MKHVLYGKCVKCGKTYDAVPDLTNCECGGILDIVYDYDYIKTRLTQEKLAARQDHTMWRYRELLPVEPETPNTPLRVGWSPLYEEPRLAEQLGLKQLWVKDDGQNPTAISEGPGQRHGGGQGPGGGGEGHRLLLHRQRRLAPSRATPRRRASRPTSSSPPGPPRARWPS